MTPLFRPGTSEVPVRFWIGVLLILVACRRGAQEPPETETPQAEAQVVVEIPRAVTIGHYFEFMDSLVAACQVRLAYPISEHLLVHANPWIMDTLAASDYYRRMARDSFVYDQRQQVALPAGSRLLLPDPARAFQLQEYLNALRLDINIPEFTLRIYEDSTEVFAFPIRVGQNRTRFLVMSGIETDLRTHPGIGRIIRHEKNPVFYNPVDGKRYSSTRRDDGRRTLMPRIPWLETEIDGQRNGQLIHPTTNPETLGRAYSNGCIGTEEAAAWIIYYHAPLGTRIQIRYELDLPDGTTGHTRLRDIYGWDKTPEKGQQLRKVPNPGPN